MASPQSQGMSAAALQEAAAYAQQYGGGSGCVIRHGYLVWEWGSPSRLADIKSATKGSVGTTILGLAFDSGLIYLEDAAWKHYPGIGREQPENVAADRLAEITVRQLATMTAGFDDGRPPRLTYPPGTSGIYSNDTSNMLAELLTLRFGRDLYEVFKERVMDPIGAAPAEWSWRDNVYRPKSVGGLKSREFASGIKITHRALARIGYLYLREGNWQGRQILSREFVRLATYPTSLPAPWPYYAFYWGSNARGSFAEIPEDSYWALGLGDSFVVVCPSLDLVAVRLGTGSRASQLPGGDEWGQRVAGFFRLVVAAVRDRHPSSSVIKEIAWDPPERIIRRAEGSDNWPITWGEDDHLYTAYGDGWGFEPKIPEKLSLGFARISGVPPHFTGVNIRAAGGEQKGDGRAGKKASGMLMVDGVLYMWVRNAGNSQLAWSTDQARTWQWAEWRFTTSFGCPTLLNFGSNYSGAPDTYVYVYSHDSDSAYTPADRMVLARVPKGEIRNRGAYEFFKKLDVGGAPVWTTDIEERGDVFVDPGRCYRSGASYNPGLGRYLWCQTWPGEDPRFEGGFAVYEAPQPWGPWSRVFATPRWDVGPGESCSFPTRWMSADGRVVHLVFSGQDSFSVRRATLITAQDQEGAESSRTSRYAARTQVSLSAGKWHINGKVTYPGAPAEGLLMNVRMVNSVFEDRHRTDFEPEANTDRFIRQIPDYAAHGVRAFTINLQGGMPGYEGALNSAFLPDGSLRESYLRRVERVIEACDRQGLVVILGCFYQRQDQVLQNDEAVRQGVLNAVNWIRKRGFTNVVLEIANEFPIRGFDHPILKTSSGQVELIRLAKQQAPDLLVSTSGKGDGKLPDDVCQASDFLLIHFNSVPVEEIPARIAALKKFGKAIVCNEDDKSGEEAARAAQLSVENGASWGLMLNTLNQYFPLVFNGAADDPVVYARLKQLTTGN